MLIGLTAMDESHKGCIFPILPNNVQQSLKTDILSHRTETCIPKTLQHSTYLRWLPCRHLIVMNFMSIMKCVIL